MPGPSVAIHTKGVTDVRCDWKGLNAFDLRYMWKECFAKKNKHCSINESDFLSIAFRFRVCITKGKSSIRGSWIDTTRDGDFENIAIKFGTDLCQVCIVTK